MIELMCFVLAVLASLFKTKFRLEAENAVLRHQLIVLRRKLRGRVQLANSDHWFFVQLYRWFPSILKVLTIIRPETLVRWHQAGFRRGRPQIETDLRALIRRMSVENPLWGAPRIHGELLKLGFEVAQSSVAKYMVKRRGPPSQGWRTFLRNHAPEIAAMDLLVVPTISFNLLYAFVIVRLGRHNTQPFSTAQFHQERSPRPKVSFGRFFIATSFENASGPIPPVSAFGTKVNSSNLPWIKYSTQHPEGRIWAMPN